MGNMHVMYGLEAFGVHKSLGSCLYRYISDGVEYESSERFGVYIWSCIKGGLSLTTGLGLRLPSFRERFCWLASPRYDMCEAFRTFLTHCC